MGGGRRPGVSHRRLGDAQGEHPVEVRDVRAVVELEVRELLGAELSRGERLDPRMAPVGLPHLGAGLTALGEIRHGELLDGFAGWGCDGSQRPKAKRAGSKSTAGTPPRTRSARTAADPGPVVKPSPPWPKQPNRPGAISPPPAAGRAGTGARRTGRRRHGDRTPRAVPAGRAARSGAAGERGRARPRGTRIRRPPGGRRVAGGPGSRRCPGADHCLGQYVAQLEGRRFGHQDRTAQPGQRYPQPQVPQQAPGAQARREHQGKRGVAVAARSGHRPAVTASRLDLCGPRPVRITTPRRR